jgi:uncharacterized membrane protein
MGENKHHLTSHAYIGGRKQLTFGQNTADALTRYAGSWFFIIFFLFFLGLWIAINILITKNYGNTILHDPFPFILLNLLLSCLAALQAPIILMSQNRAAERDRVRAEYDYHINRKSEREIEEIKKQLDRIERKLDRR